MRLYKVRTSLNGVVVYTESVEEVVSRLADNTNATVEYCDASWKFAEIALVDEDKNVVS